MSVLGCSLTSYAPLNPSLILSQTEDSAAIVPTSSDDQIHRHVPYSTQKIHRVGSWRGRMLNNQSS